MQSATTVKWIHVVRAREGRLCGLGLLAIGLLLVGAGAALAQEQPTDLQVRRSHLQAADYTAETYLPPHAIGAAKAGPAAATFDIRFSDNFPTQAREVFLYAASIWEAYLDSPVPIVVEAAWDELPEGTLGSAGPLLTGNFSSAAISNTWYPFALADAIQGRDLYPGELDIQSTFNSSFGDWYFGVDGRVPRDLYDFASVVLHELGHGLGFSGSFFVDDGDPENGDECESAPAGWGCWGIETSGGTNFPLIFDVFAEDSRGVPLLETTTYSNPSQRLADVLQSDAVFFDGTLADNTPASLYAPTAFDAGSSFSHLDEETYGTPPGGPADPNALMTPQLARGEALHDPGPVTCAIFSDLGWEMGIGCEAALMGTVGVEDDLPASSEYALTIFHPNPASDRTQAILSADESQDISVAVYDAAGRQVGAPIQFYLAANESRAINLSLGEHAPGVYFVRIGGKDFVSTRTVVRVGP